MGFQDILQIKKIPYSSDEAVELADDSMETVSYFAIEASSDLAKERGSYSSYEGSLWSQGIFPIDSISILKEHRTEGFLDQNEEKKMDWDTLKEKVKKQGIRNSNVMAIAPTATIANITGVTQSIEPTYSNLFVKSNLSGEFTVINENLVNALKEIDMWDEVMVYDLKNLNGSLETISRVPDEIKRIFATSFEIEPKWLIESASRRQKWIDQSQSLNLYVAEPNGKKLDVMYKMAWLRGLKTTYYLRSKGATTSEKSTISNSELNKVQAAVAVNNPSTIDDEECEACQ
jgi:ribonucleoside-diphosphate reductase alpha chain